MFIGERIRELRAEKGLLQRELATVIHVAPNTISQFESGKANPSYEVLISLATFFDVSTDYLLGRTDDFGNVVSTAQAQTYSADVQELVDIYDSLDEMHRVQVLEYARYFAERTQNTKRKNF